MTTDDAVGSISALWRFPVKSMRGEPLAEVELTEHGLLGDRAVALVDTATQKVASAKSVTQFPDLLRCQASYVEPPRAGGELPAVRITLPGGKAVTSDAGNVDAVLSAFFKRDVTLARAAPEDFTVDMYHPDIEDLDPAGHRDEVVEQKLGAAFFAALGAPSPVAAGTFFDLFPVTVMTTSTLDQLAELRPESRFDLRRFRMNVIVRTAGRGFLENAWVGRPLGLGATARVVVTMPAPRCVMTTLAQAELPKDTDILRTLARHNRVAIGGPGLFPCAGVYTVVAAPGALRTGDPVDLGAAN